METAETERILTEHGVNPTAVRILIYKAMERMAHTFSLADIEQELESVDKSTIFRTLTIFASNHLVHVVDDGSGSKKYCICRNQHPCSLGQTHCHFHCEVCGTTYCLPQVFIPPMSLPEGFSARRAELLYKGVCPTCQTSARS